MNCKKENFFLIIAFQNSVMVTHTETSLLHRLVTNKKQQKTKKTKSKSTA